VKLATLYPVNCRSALKRICRHQ